VYIYINNKSLAMARQSISLTRPNDEWLKSQVQSEEYSSKSELVNDLIRQAREQQKEVDWIRAKLIKAEENLNKKGYVNKSAEEILNGFKDKAKANGDL
jgi:antitoxin ParD1/3/4